MDLPINIYYWLLSIIPIVFLLFFMAKLQWSASKAALVTLMVTIIISIIFFKANTTVLISEILKGIWSTLNVFLVMVAAILLYEVSNEVNSFSVFNKAFEKMAPNELLKIMLIGIVFSSFIQGVAGFGAPVLITVPLLLGIGVSPIWAVTIPLIGHCWAGTFGTLSLAWHALIMQVGLEDVLVIKEIALYAGIFLFILNFISYLVVSFIYGGVKGIKKGFIATVLLSLTQGAGQIILSMTNPNIAAFIPSAISIFVIIILSKSPLYNKKWEIPKSKIMIRAKDGKEKVKKEHMTIHEATMPYYIVTFISLTILLIKPLNNFLSRFKYGPSFKETITGFGVVNPEVAHFSPIAPLTHAGTFLFVSGILGYLFYLRRGMVSKDSLSGILSRTKEKAIPSTIAITSLICVSRIMMGTGQTDILAQGVAKIMGSYYAIISPFIGLLGSFITSSNLASNILFGSFQYKTAELIGLNSSQILGAHTAAGSAGIAITLSSIVLGTTATGITGLEGKVLKKTIFFTTGIAGLFGVILFILNFV